MDSLWTEEMVYFLEIALEIAIAHPETATETGFEIQIQFASDSGVDD